MYFSTSGVCIVTLYTSEPHVSRAAVLLCCVQNMKDSAECLLQTGAVLVSGGVICDLLQNLWDGGDAPDPDPTQREERRPGVRCYPGTMTPFCVASRLQVVVSQPSLSVCFTSSFVQVEEGSAKPGRDFTHSTAGLVQFDPGGTRFIRHTHGDGHERLPASVIRPFCFTKLKSKVLNVQLQVPESTAVRNNQSDSAAVQPMAGRSWSL